MKNKTLKDQADMAQTDLSSVEGVIDDLITEIEELEDKIEELEKELEGKQ